MTLPAAVVDALVKSHACNTQLHTILVAQVNGALTTINTLVSEIDRWAPIIKAAGEFAD